jgi:hypothetical protein
MQSKDTLAGEKTQDVAAQLLRDEDEFEGGGDVEGPLRLPHVICM